MAKGTCASGGAQPGAEWRILKQAVHRIPQVPWMACPHEQDVFVVCADLAAAADIGEDHGDPTSGRLHRGT